MKRTRSFERRHSRNRRDSRHGGRYEAEMTERRERRERRSRRDSEHPASHIQHDRRSRQSRGSPRVRSHHVRRSSPRRSHECSSSANRRPHANRHPRYEERRETRYRPRSRSPSRREYFRDREVINTSRTSAKRRMSHREEAREVAARSRKKGENPAGHEYSRGKSPDDIACVYEKIVVPTSKRHSSKGRRFCEAGRKLELNLVSNSPVSTNEIQQRSVDSDYGGSSTRIGLSDIESGSLDSLVECFDWKNGEVIHHNEPSAGTNNLPNAVGRCAKSRYADEPYPGPSKYIGHSRKARKTDCLDYKRKTRFEKSTLSKYPSNRRHGSSYWSKDKMKQTSNFYDHQLKPTTMIGSEPHKSDESSESMDTSSIPDIPSSKTSQVQGSHISSLATSYSPRYSPPACNVRGQSRINSGPFQQRSVKIMRRSYSDGGDYLSLFNDEELYSNEMSSGFASEATNSSPGIPSLYYNIRNIDEENSLDTTSSNPSRDKAHTLQSVKLEKISDDEDKGSEIFPASNNNFDNRKDIMQSIVGNQGQNNGLLHDLKANPFDLQKIQRVEGFRPEKSIEEMKLGLWSNGVLEQGRNPEEGVSLVGIKTSPGDYDDKGNERTEAFFNEEVIPHTPSPYWDDEETVSFDLQADLVNKLALPSNEVVESAANKDEQIKNSPKSTSELAMSAGMQSSSGGWKRPYLIDLTAKELPVVNFENLVPKENQTKKQGDSRNGAKSPCILEDPRLKSKKYKEYCDNKPKQNDGMPIPVSPQRKSTDSEKGKEGEWSLIGESHPPPTKSTTKTPRPNKSPALRRFLSGKFGKIVKKTDAAAPNALENRFAFIEHPIKPVQFKRNVINMPYEELIEKYPNAIHCRGVHWVCDLLSIDDDDLKKKEDQIISKMHNSGIGKVLKEARMHSEDLKKSTESLRESIANNERPKEAVFKMRIPSSQ